MISSSQYIQFSSGEKFSYSLSKQEAVDSCDMSKELFYQKFCQSVCLCSSEYLIAQSVVWRNLKLISFGMTFYQFILAVAMHLLHRCKSSISIGLFQKKIQTGGGGEGGLRIWNFLGYQRNSMWNFQELIKNELEFPRVTKKK